jgi:hypothetical protein
MADERSQPRLGRHGGARRRKGQQGNDVPIAMRGNSREYVEARLRRDGLDHLLRAIEDRKISHFAAAVLAGYAKRRRTVSVPGDDRRSRPPKIDVRCLVA